MKPVSDEPFDMRNGSDSITCLYEKYQRPLLSHLTRLVRDETTAEDLCQETFIKALRNWHRHDPHASAVAWLYRIATNTAYDYLRRQKRIHFTPLPQTDTLLSNAYTLEHQLEPGGPVQTALGQLPPHERVPLVMHSCNGYSTQEIADTLGCSNGAIKSRLFRARAHFRQVYQQN